MTVSTSQRNQPFSILVGMPLRFFHPFKFCAIINKLPSNFFMKQITKHILQQQPLLNFEKLHTIPLKPTLIPKSGLP